MQCMCNSCKTVINLALCPQISKKFQEYYIVLKLSPVGFELFHAERQTDRQTDRRAERYEEASSSCSQLCGLSATVNSRSHKNIFCYAKLPSQCVQQTEFVSEGFRCVPNFESVWTLSVLVNN
jgi:hypothetical protein